MNESDGIPACMILKCIELGGVEKIRNVASQYQVEGGGCRAAAPPGPVLGSVAPETPKFCSVQGHLEPVVANEQEVV